MYYVYLIESINYPETLYVGYSTDINQRLETHNSGGSIHTAKFRPWKLVMYLAFEDQVTAKEFEVYLKSQSGRAFLKKRFVKTKTGRQPDEAESEDTGVSPTKL